MNRLLAAVGAALLLLPAGCNKSPEGGSPGTKDSFTVIPPQMATTIKQGNKETVTVNLNRGSDFKKSVKLDAKAPDKIKATFEKSTIGAGDSPDAKLTIDVDKDAPVGDHLIHVTATPENGTATSVDVKVKVTTP